MGDTLLKYAVLCITFGSGLAIVGYEEQARMRGWPVGRLLRGDAAFVKVFGFVCMLASAVGSFVAFRWWSPLVVVVLGFIYGFLISQILRSWVQLAAILGAVIGFALFFVL